MLPPSLDRTKECVVVYIQHYVNNSSFVLQGIKLGFSFFLVCLFSLVKAQLESGKALICCSCAVPQVRHKKRILLSYSISRSLLGWSVAERLEFFELAIVHIQVLLWNTERVCMLIIDRRLCIIYAADCSWWRSCATALDRSARPHV